MGQYEEKMKQFLKDNNIPTEFLSFNQSCHTVEEAADSLGTTVDNLVKNICLIGVDGETIIGIVNGKDRASTSQISKSLGIPRPRLATPEEILERTGYPCGGTPSFGFKARFLIDPKVMEKEYIYTSGGSETSLMKISTKELQKANKGEVVKIRK
jgi:prolyl-tRNA editing enzyme YbaK/EbsC (Cys-tRNA(Pro) deacylase)